MSNEIAAQYKDLVNRMESSADIIKGQALDTKLCRLLHAALGISGESGELTDQIKKVFAYGKEFDQTNFIEELGDILWYIQLACNVLDTDLESLIRVNIDKLEKRYPGKFTQEAALNRDLPAERTTLETSIGRNKERSDFEPHDLT